MAVRDADGFVAAVAAVVGEDKGGNAGKVHLEGQRQHVAHQADVLLVVDGDADGALELGVADLHRRAGAGDARFQLADGAQVLVKLALVVGAEAGFQLAGVFHDEVENAQFVAVALFATGLDLVFGFAGKEPFKDQAGIDFLGHGHRFRAPGEVGRVGTTVAGVAIARVEAALDAQLEGRKACLAADFFRGELIDGDADANVGAAGLARLAAGEKGGHGPGVIAGAVAVGPRRVERQAIEHQQVLLEGGQRLQHRRQIEVAAQFIRHPLIEIDAVGDVDEGHARRRLADCGRSSDAQGRAHRLQPGQGDRGPQALQHRSPRQACALAHLFPFG